MLSPRRSGWLPHIARTLEPLRPAVLRARGAIGPEERLRIEAEVARTAEIGPGYMVLLICACGIAALGLLQSSTAVVIGAMLISPLMGPILALGLALARVDGAALRRAGLSLLLGAVISVLAAAAIVALLPLKAATPEILARTRPSLLDLLIAALSGFVGAYVTITGRGAVIAGVAIATALMPPLAVVGFGMANSDWSLAGGASLLFLTNVVAMVSAAFVVARWYGFRPPVRARAAWEVAILVAALVALSAPLAISFRDIVIEVRVRSRLEAAIKVVFAGAQPRIDHLEVSVKDGHLARAEALVVTRRYVADAATRLRRRLKTDADLRLEQVLTANRARADAVALMRRTEQSRRDSASRLQTMLGGDVQVLSIDDHDGVLTASVRGPAGASLSTYRAMETAAQVFVPDRQVHLVPPWTQLPVIHFAKGRSDLDDTARSLVDDILWALGRWGVRSAEVVGSASPGRRGPGPADRALAQARARSVAAALGAAGVDAKTSVSVPQTVGPEGAIADWVARVTPAAGPMNDEAAGRAES